MSANQWVTADKASKHLGVSKGTLDRWRGAGFLKYGRHWKSTKFSQVIPWADEVSYQLELCETELKQLWGCEEKPSKEKSSRYRNHADVHMDQVILGPFTRAI